MKRNKVFIAIIAMAVAALTVMPIAADEIGSVDTRIERVPSYLVYGDAGMYPGGSAGLGVSATINVTSIVAGFLPFLGFLPDVYIEGSLPLLYRNAAELMALASGQAGATQDPFVGGLLGFGADGYSIYAGLRLARTEAERTFRWVVSETGTTVSYYRIRGPVLQDIILLAGISSERSGGAWTPAVDEFSDPTLADGSMLYYRAKLRFQDLTCFLYEASALGGEARAYKEWAYIDLEGILSSDTKQYGGSFGFGAVGGFVSFKLDFGVVYRADCPSEDILNKLYMPLTVRLGFGGNILPLNANDRYWRAPDRE